MVKSNQKDEIPKLFYAAVTSHRKNELSRAESFYQSILVADPGHKDAFNNLAALYMTTGQTKRAEHMFRTLVEREPDFASAWSNLGVIYLRLNKPEEAINCLVRALELNPDSDNDYQNLGLVYQQLEQYDKAVETFLTALEHNPDNIGACVNLARSYFHIQQIEKAIPHGVRALELKSADSLKRWEESGRTDRLRGIPLPAFNPNTPERNVIVFSLWGDNPRYTLGAVENAKLAKEIYPGWRARFYCDSSVPTAILEDLESHGAEVIMKPLNKGFEGLFWRFLANDDADVDYFICRDCDSRLNAQEADAVAEWLKSGKPFHIMRDAPFHTELIMAGMWGGAARVLPSLKSRIAGFFKEAGHRWTDQDFLRLEVWPMIYQQTLTHDTYFGFGTLVRNFPKEHKLQSPYHVGATYLNP